MTLAEIKKKGKTIQIMSNEYRDFISANVTHRIQSKEMNGSTLNCSNAVEITLKKAEGCIHQIIQRNIPLLSDEIISVEQMAEIVYGKIMEKISATTQYPMIMVNATGDKAEVDKSKLGEYVIQFI